MDGMSIIPIQPFSVSLIPSVDELQHVYAQSYPGAKVIPAGYYLSPGFNDGEDVFCAFIDGRLAAYAPCYVQINTGPEGLPHRVWVELKSYPDLADPAKVKDALLERLLERARQRLREAAQVNGPRTAQMIFEYLTTETDAIAYVLARGFAYTESVFAMSRDLVKAELPQVKLPKDPVTLKRWKMETEAEQRAYVSARNQCFPESPIQLEEWQFFMQSPLWPNAVVSAAFAGGELVGCASVYWNEEENLQSGSKAGYTEDIFVLPAWRGCGVAAALIADGLAYLRTHGMEAARLMVRAQNQEALGLYRRLGFQVGGESRFYARDL